MHIAEIKCRDRRKQRLTDVVRALKLRVAEIKRSPPVTGTQQAPGCRAALPSTGQNAR